MALADDSRNSYYGQFSKVPGVHKHRVALLSVPNMDTVVKKCLNYIGTILGTLLILQ